MSVALQTVYVQNVPYELDISQIKEDLRQQGLNETQLAQALVEIKGGDFAILWEYGLTKHISSPTGAEIPAPSPNSNLWGDVGALLSKFEGFNILDTLYALNQAAQGMRRAAREMRHADRDIAQSEALRSAKKIRDSATINMIVGVVSGAINIGMGLYSVGSSAKQLSSIKSASGSLQAAKQETAQIKADAKLADSQVKLSQAKVEAAAKQQNVSKTEAQVKAANDVKAAESKLDQLKAEEAALAKAQPPNPSAVRAKSAEIKAAQQDLAGKRSALTELGGPKTEADLAQAKADLQAANERVTQLEVEVKTNAAEAAKVNADRTATLEKDVEQKKSEISKLKEDQVKAQDEVKASKAEIERLSSQGAPESSMKKAQARHEAASERAASLGDEVKLAENAIPGLEARLAESKAQASIYKNPTSDAALKDAQSRFDSTTARLENAAQAQAAAQAEFDHAVAVGNATSANVQGWNTAVGGLTQAGKGVGEYFAADEQAKGAEHTARSQIASSSEAENADFQKAAEELMANIRSILKETLQAYNQANASIYRNM